MTEEKNIIHIICFSGTGGTSYAAKQLKEAFSKKNLPVYFSMLLKNSEPVIRENETLILMYPVYAADAPLVIYQWISRLKKVINKKAAVISVSGGGEVSPNTACRSKVIKRLKRKGYEVNNEYSLCMPSNFIMPTHDILAINLLKILPAKCEIIVKEIVYDIKRRKRPVLLDTILLPLFQGEKVGSKIAGRMMRVTSDCNGCGLCAAKCPKSNIEMKDDRPSYRFSCELCLSCVYLCPKKAIKLRIMKKFILKDGFNLKRYIDRIDEEASLDDEGIPDGFLWKGVIEYLRDVNKV